MYYFRYILGMALFGTIGVIVKNINAPTTQIVLARTLVASIIFSLVFMFTKKKLEINNIMKNFPYLLISGILLALSWILLFTAFEYTDVSVANWLNYLAPIIVIILSPIFLRESLNLLKIICICIAVAGLYLVSGIDINSLEFNKGILLSLMSATCYALIMIFNKKFKNIDGFNATSVQMFVAAITMFIYIFVVTKETIVVPDLKSGLLMLMLGIFQTGLAVFLTFSSIKFLPTNAVAFLSYLDPILSFAFAYLLLGEVLSPMQLLGSGLILFSALFAQIRRT